MTLFTREEGLIQALYRGGRSPKKQALLQAFTPLWVTINERRGWHYVNQLDLRSASRMLTGSALLAALYVNELLHHGLRAQDAAETLYDVYEQTMEGLALSTDLEPCLRRFEWHLLQVMGYDMSLTHDATSHQPIVSENHYAWVPHHGFVAAHEGFLGAHILAFSQDQLHEKEVLRSVKHIMRQALYHALGGRYLMTRDLYFR